MCRAQRPGQCSNGGLDLGTHQILEVRASEGHVEVPAREKNRHDRLGVYRKSLLRPDAVPAQPGEHDGGLGVTSVQLAQHPACREVDVGQDRFVEIATTDVNALRGTEDLDTARYFSHNHNVEGAATQVIYRHYVTIGQQPRRRVVCCGRFGFGHHERVAQPCVPRNVVEQRTAERAPVTPVSQYDLIGWFPFGCGNLLYDVVQ